MRLQLIAADPPQPDPYAVYYFRRTVTLAALPAKATLYATALGVYDAFVNGRDVDDQVLKPGWTPYRLRLTYQTADITALLRTGDNTLGLALGGGWYTERLLGQTPYGAAPAVAARLVLEDADGRVEEIGTDAAWEATADGPIRSSSLYHGETYDARLADPAAWRWGPVRLVDWPVEPEPQTTPPVRPTGEIRPVATVTSPSGQTIVDFGQNFVGRLRLRVVGPAGTAVTLRHAEVLEDGELAVRPLRAAQATDTLVLAGGEAAWEPRFTFHGFRYAEVTGVGAADADVTGVVIGSDLRRTGWFACSHDLLNRFHENVVWSMRGNFLSVPTDCPQRDERLGWTGDIQVFAPTASFLFDTRAFLTSWLKDLALEQAAMGGSVPFVVPNVLPDAATPAAAWGDAACVVPWVLYERYGDAEILRAQYPSMTAWADCLLGIAGEALVWEGGFQFGDWLDPTAPPEDAARAQTHPDIVASAYLCRSLDLAARAGAVVGAANAPYYAERAAAAKRAFADRYVVSGGGPVRMTSDAPTAYALAVAFDLVPAWRQELGDRLADLVAAAGDTIATGFVGTPLISDALTETGHLDVAGRLMLQTACPSWLYPVTMGATTIWERWDSLLPDGSVNPGEMTSFNHYAFGAVADWLHRTVAGLAPGAPGYRVVRIAPRPIAGLDWAKAELETPFGLARVGWERTSGGVTVRATVPPGSTATVSLPGQPEFTVDAGDHTWSC
jgi:alpha-L-rhamnosidase